MDTLPLPQWICFDLDGTLVDSAPDLTLSLNYMLHHMGLPLVTEDIARSWIGNGLPKLLLRAFTNAKVSQPSDEQLDTARVLFDSAYHDNVANRSSLYPGCDSVLSVLHKEQVRLGCVTNKPRRFVTPLMHKLGIDNFFSSIVCGDDLPVKKPCPEPIQKVVNELHGSPEQGYLVGDSVTDMKAAQAAGVGAIYVSYGYNRGVSVDQYKPVRIDSLRELLSLFNCKNSLDVSTS